MNLWDLKRDPASLQHFDPFVEGISECWGIFESIESLRHTADLDLWTIASLYLFILFVFIYDHEWVLILTYFINWPKR